MAKKDMPPPPGADLEAQEESGDQPEVAMPKVVFKKKLKVMATRAGFHGQHRKVAGDKFEVHEHELGDWMECEHPVERKKHEDSIKARNKKLNMASAEADKRDRESGEADE